MKLQRLILLLIACFALKATQAQIYKYYIFPVCGINLNSIGNGYSGDGGPDSMAEVENTEGLDVDGAGNLYIASNSNHCIRRIDNATKTITTVDSNINVYDVAADYAGNIYYVSSSKLYKASPPSFTPTLIGSVNYANPYGTAIDSLGKYFYYTTNNEVYQYNIVTNSDIVIAGNATSGYSGDGGPATSAKLNLGYGGIDVDNNDKYLYIADYNNTRFRKVNLTTGIITTVAGNGSWGQYTGDCGSATTAGTAFARDVAVDNLGNIYIADDWWQKVRIVDASSGIIADIAGTGPSTSWPNFYSIPASSSPFPTRPDGIAVDNNTGTVYFSGGVGSLSRVYGLHKTNQIITTPNAGNISGNQFLCPPNSSQLYTSGDPGGTWTSSNTSVATVNSSGLVTGVSLGSDTIRYISNAQCGSDTAIFVVSMSCPLAIDLDNFDATKSDNNVIVEWETRSEKSNSYFTVQRAVETNPHCFQEISKIMSKGESTIPQYYKIIDDNPYKGINYYRLQTVDNNGAITYSRIAVVNFYTNSSQLTIVPNPAKDNFKIEFTNIQTGEYLITITNTLGQSVYKKNITLIKGCHEIKLSPNIAPGTYEIVLNNNNITINSILIISK